MFAWYNRVFVYWLAAEKACHRWSFIYMLEGDCTARWTSEFKNYLPVNHGLHDVAKKFGIQKFTVIIYWKCTGYLLSSFRFPANSKQSTLWRYCVQECPNFNIWGFGLRSKRFEGSRLYSKIILGLPGPSRAPPWVTYSVSYKLRTLSQTLLNEPKIEKFLFLHTWLDCLSIARKLIFNLVT